MLAVVVSARRLSAVVTLAAAAVCPSLLSGCAEDKDEVSADGQIVPVHALEHEGSGVGLAASGNLLTLAARNKGIFVYETATPERPVPLGFIELPSVYRAMVQGTTVLGFDERRGLSLADARHLDQLQLTQALSSAELYGHVADALWIGNDLLLGSESVGLTHYAVDDGFSLVNAGQPASVPVSAASFLATLGDGRIAAAAFAGEISLYRWTGGAAAGASGQKTELTGVVPTAHKISGFGCGVTTCYAGALSDGVYVYDLPAGETPRQRARIALAQTVRHVRADGDLLLVSFLGQNQNNGWYAFKLDAQGLPQLARTVVTGSEVRDFALVGSVVYVLLEDGRLNIYDRSQL
jgi:hypothetical protein